LVIKSDGDLVGLTQYYEENEPDYRHAAIDVFLANRAHGRELGTDAVRALTRCLVDERGHDRLTIGPADDNSPRSARTRSSASSRSASCGRTGALAMATGGTGASWICSPVSSTAWGARAR
jgi:hypothetical protein